jgi:voltage-gated sodium channel
MIQTATQKRPAVSMLKGLVESRPFNLGVVALIFFGAIIVGLSTYPDLMKAWGKYITIADWVIVGCFSIEILLRISAEMPRPWRYFADPWNWFDFVIVVICILPLESDAVVAIRIIRLLRLMRIFRALPRLRLLMRGIAHSMSSVGYVAVLLFAHFFIFAILGVSVFSTDDIEHFGTLDTAFLTLFQVLTLENWPGVMAPVKAIHPVAGVIYFISFIITGTMVVMNLFVGVIVGGMSEAIQEKKSEDSLMIRRDVGMVEINKSTVRIEEQLRVLERRLRTLNEHIKSEI